MEALSEKLLSVLKSAGADLVGFADLSEVSPNARNGSPRGVAIAVALPSHDIPNILEGPTAEYYADISESIFCLTRSPSKELFISRGTSIRRKHVPRQRSESIPLRYSTLLPHKTQATRAGLGWIGKCALLVTESFGSAIRLTSILTDAELETAVPINESNCGDCFECVGACPGKWLSGQNWRIGLYRDSFFNPWSCREAARKLALERIHIQETLCGICISRCPCTQRYLKKNRDSLS